LLDFKDNQILNRRMLFFDAMMMKFRNVKLRDRNLECVACGENPSILDVSKYDYNDFCQTNCQRVHSIILPETATCSVKSFAEEWKTEKVTLVDVRPPVQYGIVSVTGSLNIPWVEIKRGKRDEDFVKLTQDKKVFIMCRRGLDSKEATDYLISKGIECVNVEGGIDHYID
jgi:adenylyltransferase/sulfurtransferase